MCCSMQHNGYIHSAGSEAARAAIAQHYGNMRAPLTMDDIIIASGCSGAIEIALRGLLNPGDNILLPKPGFPLYQALCEAQKIECRFYNLKPECNWEVDLEHMQSLVNENTKAILVNNPSNPCGSVYSKPHLENILALAESNKIPIIADEIYGDMVFGSNVFFPIASLTKTVPVVAVGGLAKQFLIPGWRVGWVMVHDRNDILKDVRTAYFKLSQNILGANSLVQSAIPDLLTPVPGSAEEQSLIEFKKRYFATLEDNAKFTMEALARIPGLEVVVPQGAMYAMVKVQTNVLTKIKDDFDLTQKLLDEESVFVLPGQCFGMTNYFRIVFSAPHEVLADAYTRLANFCLRHQ
ncbi:Tyrosine aminotransferase [Phytophthora citrophthora]|uniref:Tyrosine aminotransferase n=1 Tax=Phytophthora citrophthora TaxID=4793 RepID=A0AAD9LVC9_9STRA|nr:Tyrosine aminotransferase [Phytophthora citrophthora]